MVAPVLHLNTARARASTPAPSPSVEELAACQRQPARPSINGKRSRPERSSVSCTISASRGFSAFGTTAATPGSAATAAGATSA